MTQQKAGTEGPWLYDRRVMWLLELTIDEDEHVRFGIEGMDGQLIFALDERLLVVKPGFVRGTDFGGQVASIHHADIDNIETNVAASNSVIKINALDYQLNESHNEIYQGNDVAPAKDFMLSAALTTIPITRWALTKAKPYLHLISDFIGEAKEEQGATTHARGHPYSPRAGGSGAWRQRTLKPRAFVVFLALLLPHHH